VGVANDIERALSYVKLKAVKNSSKGKDYESKNEMRFCYKNRKWNKDQT